MEKELLDQVRSILYRRIVIIKAIEKSNHLKNLMRESDNQSIPSSRDCDNGQLWIGLKIYQSLIEL